MQSAGPTEETREIDERAVRGVGITPKSEKFPRKAAEVYFQLAETLLSHDTHALPLARYGLAQSAHHGFRRIVGATQCPPPGAWRL
ncbi:MAG: hypothetical protein JJ880_17890, partial [Roseitalea sp.]|nr:hypothetical protein [Roseitalea sp.]